MAKKHVEIQWREPGANDLKIDVDDAQVVGGALVLFEGDERLIYPLDTIDFATVKPTS